MLWIAGAFQSVKIMPGSHQVSLRLWIAGAFQSVKMLDFICPNILLLWIAGAFQSVKMTCGERRMASYVVDSGGLSVS